MAHPSPGRDKLKPEEDIQRQKKNRNVCPHCHTDRQTHVYTAEGKLRQGSAEEAERYTYRYFLQAHRSTCTHTHSVAHAHTIT